MKLAIAFGSRGRAHALAHYEPARAVINLTKMKGAGSLAHEFGHALDDMLGHRVGLTGVDTMLSDNLHNTHRLLYDTHVVIAMKEVVRAMCKSEFTKQDLLDTYNSSIESCNEDIDKYTGIVWENIKAINSSYEITSEFDALKDRVFNCDDDAIHKMMDLHEKVTGARDVTINIRLQKAINLKREKQDRIKNIDKVFEIYKEKSKPTNYYECAKKLDVGRKKIYYSDIREMFARAFESFVEDTLYERGIISQYLVHSTRSNEAYGNIKPYPEGEERVRINEAIRNLLDIVYQTYKDDFGEITDFSMYNNTDDFVSYQDSIYIEKKPKKTRRTKEKIEEARKAVQDEVKKQDTQPTQKQSGIKLTGDLKDLREAIVSIGGNNTKRDKEISYQEYVNAVNQLAMTGKSCLGYTWVGFKDFRQEKLDGMFNSKSCYADGKTLGIDKSKPMVKQIEGMVECLVYTLAYKKYGKSALIDMVAEGTTYAVLKSMGLDVRTYCLSDKYVSLAKDITQSQAYINVCRKCFVEFKSMLSKANQNPKK